MLDFKLISVDDHVNEHPAAWERAQREFGDRAPHIVENPPELGKGLWIIAEGLPPVRSAYFALGHVVEKPEGISNMTVMEDREKFRKNIIEFNKNFRYEDWPAGWEPSARLKDMDRDGVEAAVFFSSPTRFNYSQNDGKLQRRHFSFLQCVALGVLQLPAQTFNTHAFDFHSRHRACRSGHKGICEGRLSRGPASFDDLG
jgi:hypothetical protein